MLLAGPTTTEQGATSNAQPGNTQDASYVTTNANGTPTKDVPTTGIIVGAVVGLVFVMVLIILVIVICRKRKRRKK